MSLRIREAVFSLVSLIFSILFWYFLRTVFYFSFSYINLALSGIFLLCLALIYALISILFKEKYLFWINSILIIVPLLLFSGFNFLYLIIAVASILIAFSGFIAVRNLKNSQAQIYLSQLIKKSSAYFFNATVLVLLVIFYFSPLVQEVDKFQLPRFLFDPLLKISQPIISGYLPGFDAGQTVDESIANLYLQSAQSQLGQLNINPKELIKLPRYKQFIKEQRDALAKQIGMKLNGNEKSGDVVYKFVNNEIISFNKESPLYFRISIVLILLSILKFLFWIIKYLDIIFGLAVISFLKLLKVVRIEKVMVEKEELVV